MKICVPDPRFPIDGVVELHFSPGPEARHPAPAPTPAVPFVAAIDDPIVRADSPFNYEEYEEDNSDSGKSKLQISGGDLFKII